MAPCARLPLMRFGRCADRLQRKKQLRWEAASLETASEAASLEKPQKKNRSPLLQQRKALSSASSNPTEVLVETQPRKGRQQWRKQNRRKRSCQQPEPEQQQPTQTFLISYLKSPCHTQMYFARERPYRKCLPFCRVDIPSLFAKKESSFLAKSEISMIIYDFVIIYR